MKYKWHSIIERDGREIDVKIDFDYRPGAPATMEQPEDPEEIEVHYQAFDGPRGYLLTSEEMEAIEMDIRENWIDEGPDPDDLRDQARDDRLWEAGL